MLYTEKWSGVIQDSKICFSKNTVFRNSMDRIKLTTIYTFINEQCPLYFHTSVRNNAHIPIWLDIGQLHQFNNEPWF